jgi:hypothetical protein
MATENRSTDVSVGLDGQRPLQDELKTDCQVMIKYALASGLKLPPVAVQALRILSGVRQAPSDTMANGAGATGASEDLNILAQAHEQLSQLVAPATPRTLLYSSSEMEKTSRWKFLGPIRIVSSIVGGALGFLLAFVLMSVFLEQFGSSNRDYPFIFDLQLLAAAGMGGSFAALFEASRYITNSTFDPRYKGYYWVKIVLGLTAGYILAQLIHPGVPAETAAAAADAGKAVTDQAAEHIRAMHGNFSQATLAVLGGFSGTVVYNILKRLSESVESMVLGDPQAALSAQQATARAQATDEINRTKIKQAAGLLGIQNLLATKSTPEDVQKQISQLMADLGVGVLDIKSRPPDSGSPVTSKDEADATPVKSGGPNKSDSDDTGTEETQGGQTDPTT